MLYSKQGADSSLTGVLGTLFSLELGSLLWCILSGEGRIDRSVSFLGVLTPAAWL